MISDSIVKVLDFGLNKQEDSNFHLFYCNGILTDDPENNLEKQAEIISNAFGNHKVTVFKNPTTLAEYLCLNQTHYEREEKEQRIANEVADSLRRQLEKLPLNSSSHRICLVAHSHGAWITKKALEILSFKERQYLQVYTFGGVSMISKI